MKYVPYAYDVVFTLSSATAVMKLAEWLMTTTRKYFLYKTVSPKNKAVLITGKNNIFMINALLFFNLLKTKLYISKISLRRFIKT